MPVLICVVLIIAAILFAVFPSRFKKSRYPWLFAQMYAHRGLFMNNGRPPENSLAAFAAAAEQGYGIELDVQLSRDGEVMVFHDESLKRMTGTDAALGSLDYSQLSALRLLDSDQTIPLFSQVLSFVGGRVPLIVELKRADERTAELCEKTYALLKQYNGDYCIESFDPRIVRWFYKNAPDVVRGQLSTKHAKSSPIYFMMTNLLTNFLCRPHFIAYDHRYSANVFLRLCKALGAFTVAWTIRSKKELDRAAPFFDCIIFESFDQ